jgi:hypothetical protein
MMEKKFKEIQNHDTKSFHLFFFNICHNLHTKIYSKLQKQTLFTDDGEKVQRNTKPCIRNISRFGIITKRNHVRLNTF